MVLPYLDWTPAKVQTEVELENGQSLVIVGLLDNRVTESLSKIPGLANIPLLGKLFESRALLKSNSELFILVTPEIVQPIPVGAQPPALPMPQPFLKDAPATAPQNPAPSAGTSLPKQKTLPVETLKDMFVSFSDSNSAQPAASNNNSQSGSRMNVGDQPAPPRN